MVRSWWGIRAAVRSRYSLSRTAYRRHCLRHLCPPPGKQTVDLACFWGCVSQQILKTQIARDGEDAKGKFGRILGDFIVHYTPEDRQTKASEIMILEGYAVAYHGQNKEDVEQEHLNNRERLIKEKKVVL